MLFLAPFLQTSASIMLMDGFAIPATPGRRSPIRLDAVDYALVTGAWHEPREGDKFGNGTVAKVTANKDGFFEGPAARGDTLFFAVESPTEHVMMLNAVGNSMVYVNGEPRVGDAYSFGYVTIPILLKKGRNELLFATGRGRFKATLTEPPKPVSFDQGDMTLPDIISGDKGEMDGAVVVRNATTNDLKGVRIRAGSSGDSSAIWGGNLLACQSAKVPFAFRVPKGDKIQLTLLDAHGKALDSVSVPLRRRKQGEPFKRTFLSRIDASVQYYGVNPSRSPKPNQALFLSLHGASVEGIGQAEAYSPKDWGYIVAPTNRRPYGFDWEDIGRLDALEVLEDARARFKTDPSKTYLTGHSMGGHGTWQLGVLFPDKFAAIAPSAGWSSFFSYGGGVRYADANPIQAILQRATNASDTLLMKSNYKQEAVYVLHGDADDNVPISEARAMRAALAPFHKDIDFWEQPKAGHWWDASPEPGADCVDWVPIFDLFGRRRIPSANEVRDIDFTTVSPGVSAKCHWVTINQQDRAFLPSRVQLKLDPISAKITGTTDNVSSLDIENPAIFNTKWTVNLDGQSMEILATTAHLEKSFNQWKLRVSNETSGSLNSYRPKKSPNQSGGFKSVFDKNVVFVYGTHGTSEENAWAKAKVRYDAETFWYRGNGSPSVMTDDMFLQRRKETSPRTNIVLYGNRKSNAAFSTCVELSDFDLTEGRLALGDQVVDRNDAAVFVIRPLKSDRNQLVGIIGGTGIVGMNLTNRGPIFTSGAGYPDCLVLEPETLRTGTNGVIAAGFFGNDWSVKNGEFAWRK